MAYKTVQILSRIVAVGSQTFLVKCIVFVVRPQYRLHLLRCLIIQDLFAIQLGDADELDEAQLKCQLGQSCGPPSWSSVDA